MISTARIRRQFLFLILFFSFSLNLQAAEKFPAYIPPVRDDFSTKEKALNFGVIYGLQWGYYLVAQRSIIEKNGSLENWIYYPFSPHFDKDSFDYNIFQHTLAGAAYYLTYRSQGYTEQNAFFWTFMSSLAFEFTIETVTERPSYQDIYQTPVFGTVLGIGVEKLSRYLHQRESWWGHALGYLINPFTLLPRSKINEDVVALPYFDGNNLGAIITYRF